MPYMMENNLEKAKKLRNQRVEKKNRKLLSVYEPRNIGEAFRPFAYGMGFDKLFWLFVIASVLGVVFETFWAFVTLGRFEMRTSLVIGMFIPVYGIGAVAMTICLRRLYRLPDLFIFIGSAVIGGAVEFLCSLGQQLALGTTSWNYSHTALNIAGRTNIGFSLIWGTLGIFWIKNWYPMMSNAIEKIPKKAGRVLTIAVTVFLVLDMALSAAAVLRKVERYEHKPPENALAAMLDRYFNDSYLNFVYPHMQVAQHR